MLKQMTARLHCAPDLESAVEIILDDVIALHGAEYGDIQLCAGDELVLVAQRGLSEEFVRVFQRVRPIGGCACARAMRNGSSVIIYDVEQDEEYAPFRAIARQANYRSVQTTPLMASGGMLLGMVSTLFRHPHQPTPIEMSTINSYAQIAASALRQKLGKS